MNDHPTNHFILIVLIGIFMALAVIVRIWLSGIDLNGCSDVITYNCHYIDSDY